MSIPPPPPRRRTAGPGASEPDSKPPSPPPPDRVARAAGREQSDRKDHRSKLLLGGVVLVAVALIAVGIVVTSGGGGKEEPKLDTTTSVQLERGELFVESVVPFDAIPSNFPAEASDAAMALLEAYVQEATIEPLRTGTIKDTALPEIFDGPAVARLATLDRAVLLDEGLPKAVGKVTVEGTPIGLTALLDDRKNAVLITASIDIEITAESKKGLMTVSRIGALVLSRQLDATWKITAWSLHVDRSGPGVTPTPTEPTTTTVAA